LLIHVGRFKHVLAISLHC